MSGEMQADYRPSLLTIDARLEAKEEGYAPAHEMPIKKLAFTPYKGAAESITQQCDDADAAQPSTDIPADIEQRAEPSAAVASSENENIKVFLRVKPLPHGYTGESTMTVVDDTTVALLQPASADKNIAADRILKVTDQDKYRFTQVLGPETQQQEMYEAAAHPMVEAMVGGQDGLIFAYGPTNSGKTFTIQGEKGENAGMLPRILSTLFEMVAAKVAGGEGWTVWVTFMEIYNENVYDLLDQPADKARNEQRKVCKLKEHNGHVHVKGLRELQVRCLEEARQVLRYGARQRQVAETMMNDSSSRSHCVFNAKLVPDRGPDTDPTDPAQVFSKLAVVDLAGSERATRTRATGDRLKEASNINVSLMNLGRCLEALRWNQLNPTKVAHVVPFRHSKLTRIFQDHFLNASRMAMIVAANPQQEDFDEALHALRYGAIAKEVNVQKTMNTRKPYPAAVPKKSSNEGSKQLREQHEQQQLQQQQQAEWEEVQVDDLVEELEGLRAEVYELQAKNAQLEDKVREEVCEEMMRQMTTLESAFQIRVEEERVGTEQKFERKLAILVRELSRREEVQSQADMHELQVQLRFYQARVAEMQREHKGVLARLMPGSAAAGEGEGGEGEGEGEESAEELRSTVRVLTSKVGELQREAEEKGEELEKKRKQQNESRLVLEEADGAIRQLEQRTKQLEEQNDRLREELASAQEQAHVLAERGSSSEEALLNTIRVLEAKVEAMDRRDGARESTRAYPNPSPSPRPAPGIPGSVTNVSNSNNVSTSSNGGNIAGLQLQGAPPDAHDAPPPNPSLAGGGGAREQRTPVGGGGGSSSKGGANNVHDCPVHLLAYMLPDDDHYQRSSPLRNGGVGGPRVVPLSPSQANIKANSNSNAPQVLAVKEVPRSAKGVRRLYNGAGDMAEELNDAAGAQLVEPSPMGRRLRSTGTGAR